MHCWDSALRAQNLPGVRGRRTQRWFLCHGMDMTGVSAQGFRKHGCAFSLLRGGGLAQAPPEAVFCLVVTPFPVG